LPKDLPLEEVVNNISEEDKVCACWNSALHNIGEDRSEKHEFIMLRLK
jgi:transposase